jgi:hypothetical protein
MAESIIEPVAASESEESSNPKKRQRDENDSNEDLNNNGEGKTASEGKPGFVTILDGDGFVPRPNKLPKFTSPGIFTHFYCEKSIPDTSRVHPNNCRLIFSFFSITEHEGDLIARRKVMVR